jgi:hypothetical protein
MSSARALAFASRELIKLAENLSRPLADEVLAIAAELKHQSEALSGAKQFRSEAYKNSPLHARAGSGAKGSSWPAVERNLNKTY